MAQHKSQQELAPTEQCPPEQTNQEWADGCGPSFQARTISNYESSAAITPTPIPTTVQAQSSPNKSDTYALARTTETHDEPSLKISKLNWKYDARKFKALPHRTFFKVIVGVSL